MLLVVLFVTLPPLVATWSNTNITVFCVMIVYILRWVSLGGWLVEMHQLGIQRDRDAVVGVDDNTTKA